MTGKEFEDKLERQFRAAGFDFERESAIGGLRPDFLVKGPHGEVVIIEAKSWDPKGGNTARALERSTFTAKQRGRTMLSLYCQILKKITGKRGLSELKRLSQP
jgi:hypothetical protein